MSQTDGQRKGGGIPRVGQPGGGIPAARLPDDERPRKHDGIAQVRKPKD
jgi:hypothetical protein